MRRVLPALVLSALAALTWTTHDSLIERRATFPQDEDLLYLPPPRHLELMSLGYREALADLVWCRAVVFAGDSIGAQNFSWITKYLEAIFSLAPKFRRPYHWAGVTFIYTGEAEIKRAMVDRSIEMYRRGVEQYPEDHELLFSLGMLLYRDVQSVEGYSEQERAKAKPEGVEFIKQAAAFGAPPLIAQLAATLVGQFASDQLAIRFLENQLLVTDDKQYRELLLVKLRRLVGDRAIERIEEMRTSFLAEKRQQLPYISDSLYTIIRDNKAADPSVDATTGAP